MIKSANRFLYEFESIASKYLWYFETHEYKESGLVVKRIRGISQDRDDNHVYDPLTAYVKETTGESVNVDRFDRAGALAFIPPEVVVFLVDVCDDWPNQLNGYKPKKSEKDTRDRLLGICGLQ